MTDLYSPEVDGSLEDALEELVAAEDFLNFFNVPFDQNVVHINRLHIMQRYHDYLESAEMIEELDDKPRFELQGKLLFRAYQDFVESDALTEKVFKVFKAQEPQTAFVPIDQLLS